MSTMYGTNSIIDNIKFNLTIISTIIVKYLAPQFDNRDSQTRDQLANERSLLASIRTATSILIAGMALFAAASTVQSSNRVYSIITTILAATATCTATMSFRNYYVNNTFFLSRSMMAINVSGVAVLFIMLLVVNVAVLYMIVRRDLI